MKKLRILALILALCAALVLPAAAGGEEPDKPAFSIGSTSYFQVDKSSGKGWSYDGKGHFSFQNCTGSADQRIILTGMTIPVTLTFSGTNVFSSLISADVVDKQSTNVTIKVVSGKTTFGDKHAGGILAGSLTVSGSGSLAVGYQLYCDSLSIQNAAVSVSSAFRVLTQKNLTLSGSASLVSDSGLCAKGSVSGSFYNAAGAKLSLGSDGYVKEKGASASYVRALAVGADPFNPFSDVLSGSYYHDAVLWAVGKNVTTGTSATTFSPNATCTQAQILTFLWRAEGSPASSAQSAYTDSAVSLGKYYYTAFLWAQEKGVVTDKALSPNADCTRGDVVTYLWRLAGSPASADAPFTDVPAGGELAQAASWASAQGVTTGTSATTFAPSASCTRGQIVTFLHRSLGK